MKDKDLLQFKDWLDKIENKIGREEWTTAYGRKNEKEETISIFCSLIPKKKVNESLVGVNWELYQGNGRPGFIEFHNGSKVRRKYYRHSNLNGCEPLIYERSFGGEKYKSYLEISEEFRLYFDLYEDKVNKKFIKVFDDGEEEDVIYHKEQEIQIKTKYLLEFITAKRMVLAIYFDIMRFSEKNMVDLAMDIKDEVIQSESYIYHIGSSNINFFVNKDLLSQFFIYGKKIVKGHSSIRCLDLFKEDRRYAEFIIGLDDNLKEKRFTCDNGKLNKTGTPSFLTLIYFKKDVLSKYYNLPEKYTIGDGFLSLKGFWTLKIDNNHPNFIIVFLKDLADLPYKEQLHWSNFNVFSEEGISHTNWSRNFMVEWTNPEAADLAFRQKYAVFNKKWFEEFGWYFFLPLDQKDNYHLDSLHIPLTNDQKEFDEQITSLVKVFIDSMNEKEIAKGLTLKQEAKGIDKLESFLENQGLHFEGMIPFFRALQNLRSTGAAHRKGSHYKKNLAIFNPNKKDLPKVFKDILANCIKTINSFSSVFLKDKHP